MTSTTAGCLSTAFPRANQQSTTTSIIPSNSFKSQKESTLTLYSLIRDGRFQDVIRILSNEIQVAPASRAALSLLAYSYYHVQDFHAASNWYVSSLADTPHYATQLKFPYEQLIRFYPDVHDYRLFYAQSLFKSANYVAAQKVCQSIDAPQLTGKLLKLQAAIKYEMDDIADQFVAALKCIAEIIEKGIREYPDEGAREALTDMPPRQEYELDHITLHNQAMMNMDENPSRYLYDFLKPPLLKQTSPEEAYKKFDDLANKHIDELRKLTKRVQEARQNHDNDTIKRVVNDYDEAVESDIWATFAIWISFWGYIMTSQNEEAEELMRRIEKEEERVSYEDISKRTYHLCIVNLVIGTLYCAKGIMNLALAES
ncbi:tetratricopeptide repeat protein 30A [Batrachochytrium salamandrivorans]|nr:tetratricopeptide repeat protein 30A [Batrachochytrium salamandrivorans]